MKNETLFNQLHEEKDSIHSIDYILEWIKAKNSEVYVNIERIPFKSMKNWCLDRTKSNIRHESGKFFSIEGLTISDETTTWDQPIINQPEIGFLGFIVKKIKGKYHFLVQAKIEPGNVNKVQLSPTIQATKSNFTQVHKGRLPDYIEFFQNPRKESILLDQIQSEQGSRFFKKRNRNFILLIQDHVKVKNNFIWITLNQIKTLMKFDNLVNMDTRSVISSIPYIRDDKMNLENKNHFSKLPYVYSNNSLQNILGVLARKKVHSNMMVTSKPITKLKNWVYSEEGIYHNSDKYFEVIYTRINIENREVSSWCQPMIKAKEVGLCVLFTKTINGKIHFLFQIKTECGNLDIAELGPTIQTSSSEQKISYQPEIKYQEELINNANSIVFESLQSEEGGRFFEEQNKNILLDVRNNFENLYPNDFVWVSLDQVFLLIQFNNIFNIQARSILAGLKHD